MPFDRPEVGYFGLAIEAWSEVDEAQPATFASLKKMVERCHRFSVAEVQVEILGKQDGTAVFALWRCLAYQPINGLFWVGAIA
jgi:hypothetical protein